MRFKLALLAVLLAAGGCRRGSEDRYERLLIPNFENLTGEPRYEWWGFALAEATGEAVTGSPRIHVLRAGSWWDAPALRVTHLLHASLTREGKRLRLEAALEDLGRRRMRQRCVVEGTEQEGPAPLADRLAAALGLRARDVSDRSASALEAYTAALRLADPAPLLERAIALDPVFLSPYLLLARVHLARGDRQSAEAALGRALNAGLDRVSRARAELVLAGIRGDPGAHERALEALARLTPADPEVFEGLATRSLARRDYARAARAYREALARDPDNALLLNQAGYALAYAGSFEEAVQLLLRYRHLQPSDPNPPDSLGDAYFMKGEFAQAEAHYLASLKIFPEFAGGGARYKAAWARLLAGDRAGADRHMTDFLRRREEARDPLVELRRAHWEYLTGRSRQATARLLAYVQGSPPGELRSLAAGFLCAWSLETGDRAQARKWASQAASGLSPQARDLARLCQFVAGEEVATQEWARRAAASFPQATEAGLRDTALAFALLLGGHFREALPVIQVLLERTPPSPGEILPVLAAWAGSSTGLDVGPWLVRWPTPVTTLPQPFDFLAWPRLVFLHAKRAEALGAKERSVNLYRLFLQTLGDRPGHGAERETARQATGTS